MEIFSNVINVRENVLKFKSIILKLETRLCEIKNLLSLSNKLTGKNVGHFCVYLYFDGIYSNFLGIFCFILQL